MRPEAVLVSTDGSTPIDARLIALMQHWGVRVRRTTPSALLRDTGAAAGALVLVNIAELAGSTGEIEDTRRLHRQLQQGRHPALLYNPAPGDRAARVLDALTDGAVVGAAFIEGEHAYAVADAELAGAVAGAVVGPVVAPWDLALDVAGSGGSTVLVEADSRPLLVKTTTGGTATYVLGTCSMLDLEEQVERLDDVRAFSQFVPLVMVMRDVFGDTIWHASASYANVVIDDPLLRPRYGFVDYRRLLERMDAQGYATSVAFIPFNRRRSSREVARLFTERSDRLSLSIHGCDHTRREFAFGKQDRADEVVAEACLLMDEHRRRFELDHERVMVFPQGAFSANAMQALEAQGFDAAVNSGPRAVDDRRPFTAREFLAPVITRYGGLPLLLRRYPENEVAFALDAFLGRPALVVTHPPDYRDNGPALEGVVRMLNRPGSVRWASPGTIARELHMVRRAGADRLHVRAIGGRCVLRNDSTQSVSYTVSVPDPHRLIQRISARGEQLDLRRYGDDAFVRLRLEPTEECTVEAEVVRPAVASVMRRTARERLHVLARRRASEIRDTHLPRGREAVARVRALLGLAARSARGKGVESASPADS